MSSTKHVAVGTLSLRPDGILHTVFDFDFAPTIENAKEYADARNELVGSNQVAVVIEIRAVPYTDRETRAFLMRSLKPALCRAVVTVDSTHMALYSSFEMVDPVRTPTSVFPSVDLAIDWINEIRADPRPG